MLIRKIDTTTLDPLLAPIGFTITDHRGASLPDRAGKETFVWLTEAEAISQIGADRLQDPVVMPFPFISLFVRGCQNRPTVLGEGLRVRVNQMAKDLPFGRYTFPQMPPDKLFLLKDAWPDAMVTELKKELTKPALRLCRQFREALRLFDGEWPSQREVPTELFQCNPGMPPDWTLEDPFWRIDKRVAPYVLLAGKICELPDQEKIRRLHEWVPTLDDATLSALLRQSEACGIYGGLSSALDTLPVPGGGWVHALCLPLVLQTEESRVPSVMVPPPGLLKHIERRVGVPCRFERQLLQPGQILGLPWSTWLQRLKGSTEQLSPWPVSSTEDSRRRFHRLALLGYFHCDSPNPNEIIHALGPIVDDLVGELDLSSFTTAAALDPAPAHWIGSTTECVEIRMRLLEWADRIAQAECQVEEYNTPTGLLLRVANASGSVDCGMLFARRGVWAHEQRLKSFDWWLQRHPNIRIVSPGAKAPSPKVLLTFESF